MDQIPKECRYPYSFNLLFRKKFAEEALHKDICEYIDVHVEDISFEIAFAFRDLFLVGRL